MLTEREEMIVAWLRRGCDWELYVNRRLLKDAADAIERGEHLKRPDPTVPASKWVSSTNLKY